MTAPLFTLIGMGDDGIAGLPAATAALIGKADHIVGSARLLELLPASPAQRTPWPSPFDPMAKKLRRWAGKSVVVLATGDPMWFGAGSTLLRHFSPDEFAVIPHVSAFQLAAARMGWPMQDCAHVSLHGRPVSRIEPHIAPGARLLVLTSGATSLIDIARRFVDRGFADSRFTVLEHMGGEFENRISFTAGALPETPCAGFHTLAIECIAGPDAIILPRTPGLPDDAFVHDGQLTKREVRAMTLAALAPAPGALLWDIGAGCGSVAIEWMRSTDGARAIAFERNDERIAMIEHNRDRLGTPELEIIAGELPKTLADQPSPDAIFIGGNVASSEQFNHCWAMLQPHGRLVANAVTLDSAAYLNTLQSQFGGELARIAVENLTEVGAKRAMRPRMTVTQWRVTKS